MAITFPYQDLFRDGAWKMFFLFYGYFYQLEQTKTFC